MIPFFAAMAMLNRQIPGQGGAGGANTDNNPSGASWGTQTAAFYNTGSGFLVPGGVTQLKVRCLGGGGAGSLTARGGAGAYVEAVVPCSPGETWTAVAGAPAVFDGTNGGGGNPSYFTRGSIYIGAAGGGGGGSGNQGAAGGSDSVASAGTAGTSSSGGAGGNSAISSGVTNKVSKRSDDPDSAYADPTTAAGIPASKGGALGANGGEGKIIIFY